MIVPIRHALPEQAGIQWVEEASEAARAAVLHVDVSAVEQILFNLVDGACFVLTLPLDAPGAATLA